MKEQPHAKSNIKHTIAVMSGKGGDILLETCRKVLDEEYPEYADKSEGWYTSLLVELDIEDETDAPEADAETEDTTPEQDANKETNFFEMIMNFIKAIIEMILSRIPVPYK